MANDGLQRSILGPPAEAVVDRLPVAVPLGQVAPGSAGTEDPEDAVEDLPVVLERTAAALHFQEQRFDALKLLVGQFVAAARHPENCRIDERSRVVAPYGLFIRRCLGAVRRRSELQGSNFICVLVKPSKLRSVTRYQGRNRCVALTGD